MQNISVIWDQHFSYFRYIEYVQYPPAPSLQLNSQNFADESEFLSK